MMLPEFQFRFSIASSALLLVLTAIAVPAAEPSLPSRLGQWQRLEQRRARASDLERLVAGQAPLLREYGARRATQANYHRGTATAQVTLHEMEDRSGAYGAFTLLRAGGQAAPLGEDGARVGERYVFYQGNCLVTTEGAFGVTDLKILVGQLQKQKPVQASLPTLPLFLPQQGLIAGSDRYLLGPVGLGQVVPIGLGDWVGFAYGAEAEAARYRVGNAEAMLLLISYPTPQIAAERLRDFERLFNLNGAGDPLRPLAYAKRAGSLIVFAFGPIPPQAAAQLLEQVRYEAQVSWSRPAQPREQLDWADTVLGIFMGTAILLSIALLSGLAMGLVRLLVKRWLPGRVFDRPEDTEIIVLDLGQRR